MLKNIARVRRDGQAVEIDAAELVPGDIVLMEAGNMVPADGRLFVAATLEIEEAALTGEKKRPSGRFFYGDEYQERTNNASDSTCAVCGNMLTTPAPFSR